ncbi:hypothetical protein [Mucilaginibacter sp.]|uniref:hypothetical protein n=1 Tax=Mucilaginibacter sp. TaxID=1882438 RepID=UPI0035BC8ABC
MKRYRRYIPKAAKSILLLGLAVISVTSAKAQVLQQAQNNFNQYQQNTLQEKIFAHTDRAAYIAGDIIWFKLYCVDAGNHRLLDISKVAYVEILDDAQVASMLAKISLKNGVGNGSFVIPSTIANGNYKLRAYTSWMKNFGPETFFEKQITIINTLRFPNTAKADIGLDAQFFPEGGNMVNGITSNVGFKAVDPAGKGVDFKGVIVDQRNDTVVRFQPLKFGMGQFAFTPKAGNHYKAIIRTAGTKTFVKDLPAANSSGYTMQLTDAGENLTVKVRGTLNSTVYLFAHTAQLTKLAQSADMADGLATFNISKAKLDDGVSHLTIFNNARQPVCERLYFKRPKQSLFITANPDLQQYTTRKHVSVQVTSKDNAGKWLPSSMSMAVYKLDSLQNGDQDDIASYLWLSSDLKGTIESPVYYLKNTSAEADAATNNLMLTQGWRRFQWNSILQSKPAFNYLPEYNGHIVTAKVVDTASKQPVKGVIAYMAMPGKRVQMYAALSDTTGRFLFNTKDFYGPNEIVVQTNTGQDTVHRLEVLSPFAEQYTKTALPGLTISNALRRSLEEGSLSAQVQNTYAGNRLKTFYDPGLDSSGFFGTAFKVYKLDDYTRFLTMEEVLKEYVREVAVSKTRGRFHITIHDEAYNLSGDPLVLLDGIPVFNIDKALALDPLKIRKLDVIRQRYYYGPSVYEGILSFTTYKGDLGGTEMDPHAVVIDYEGMQLQREFYSPLYDNDAQLKSRLPDFRNLLYWSPAIDTGLNASNVSFYTSDQTGKYIGVLQGIGANGQAGVQVFKFDVK